MVNHLEARSQTSAKQRLERPAELESNPASVVETRGGQDAPVSHRTWKTHGDAVEPRQRLGEAPKCPEQHRDVLKHSLEKLAWGKAVLIR